MEKKMDDSMPGSMEMMEKEKMHDSMSGSTKVIRQDEKLHAGLHGNHGK